MYLYSIIYIIFYYITLYRENDIKISDNLNKTPRTLRNPADVILPINKHHIGISIICIFMNKVFDKIRDRAVGDVSTNHNVSIEHLKKWQRGNTIW